MSRCVAKRRLYNNSDTKQRNKKNNILIKQVLTHQVPPNTTNKNKHIKILTSHTQTSKTKDKTDFIKQTPEHLGNADTGTTGMFFACKDASMLREVHTTESGIAVKQPDGSIIRSTHVGILDVPTIGPTVAHIFPSLVGSLISISVLVDLGLTATYSNKNVCICQGERERSYVAIEIHQLAYGCWIYHNLQDRTPHLWPFKYEHNLTLQLSGMGRLAHQH